MVYRDPSKNLFSEDEAASLLGMTKRMLAKRRYDGKIGHCKDGHFIGYSQKHIDTYCEKFDKERAHSRQSVSLASHSKKEREPWAQRKLRHRKVSAEQREKDAKAQERTARKRAGTAAAFIALMTGVRKVMTNGITAGDSSTVEQTVALPKPRYDR